MLGIICTEVSKGSCGNIQSGSTPTTWGLSSTGPVIYDVSKVVFEENTTFCPGAGASKRVKVQIKAYDPAGRLLGEAMQPSFKYVRTDGQELTLGATSFQGLHVHQLGQERDVQREFVRADWRQFDCRRLLLREWKSRLLHRAVRKDITT